MAKTPWEWMRLDTVDSTNAEARRRAQDEHPGRLVIAADRQTAGRGRLGRSWHSPAGAGAFFTQLLRPAGLAPQDAQGVVFVAALAMANALSEYLNVKIKWPNDLVANGKKLAGILAESGLKDGKLDWLIAGVGVNLTNEAFPEDLPHATSVLAETGLRLERDELIRRYLDEFDRVCALWQEKGLPAVLAQIAPISATLGKAVRVECAEAWTGLAKGFAPDGGLVVEKDGEDVTVFSGEASVRGLYGYI